MKRFLIMVGILVAAFVAWSVYENSKESLAATIDLKPTQLAVTNGNDQTWTGVKVVLNGLGVDGSELRVRDIKPGESVTFQLADFQQVISRLSFDPTLETVHQVTIQADGFQDFSFKR